MTATVRVRRSSTASHVPTESFATRTLSASGAAGLAWVTGLNALIGAIAWQSSLLATLHLVVTMGALVLVGLTARTLAPVVGLTVYAGLCDVLWRMSGARGPYEASKYALVFGMGIVVVRFVRQPRDPALPLVLIISLLPGVIVGANAMGPAAVREYVIANLGGLVALALGVLAFWSLRVSPRNVRHLYLLCLGPCISVATFATLSTVTAKDLDFGNSSNFVAAGGFGPNQVSALLGFGALLCILLILQRDVSVRFRVASLAIGVWLVGQAVLTFSRGGLLSLVLALAAVGLAALTLSGQRMRVLVAAGVLMAVGIQILSWAGAFTDGASDERFSSADTTNRGDIAALDMDVFWDNPLWGVGVGRLKSERNFTVESAAHTEYTRLLAEHGVLGLFAIGALAGLSLRILRGTAGWHRMAAAGLIALSLSTMAHSATRIGSIPLAFALAALRGDDP